MWETWSSSTTALPVTLVRPFSVKSDEKKIKNQAPHGHDVVCFLPGSEVRDDEKTLTHVFAYVFLWNVSHPGDKVAVMLTTLDPQHSGGLAEFKTACKLFWSVQPSVGQKVVL
jgi:hypothetical protein